jgi:hypothetical protein
LRFDHLSLSRLSARICGIFRFRDRLENGKTSNEIHNTEEIVTSPAHRLGAWGCRLGLRSTLLISIFSLPLQECGNAYYSTLLHFMPCAKPE